MGYPGDMIYPLLLVKSIYVEEHLLVEPGGAGGGSDCNYKNTSYLGFYEH